MLFAIERPRVEAMAYSKQSESPIRKNLFEKFACGIGQKLCYVGTNLNSRHARIEKRIDKADNSSERKTDNPGSNGRNRHVWIILIWNNGADNGVRRVVGDKSGFHFHLLHKELMLLGIIKHIVIILKLFSDILIPIVQSVCDSLRKSSIFLRTFSGKLGS